MSEFAQSVQTFLQETKSDDLLGESSGDAWYEPHQVSVHLIVVERLNKFWIDTARDAAQQLEFFSPDDYPCGLTGAVIYREIEPGTDIPDDVYCWRFDGERRATEMMQELVVGNSANYKLLAELLAKSVGVEKAEALLRGLLESQN